MPLPPGEHLIPDEMAGELLKQLMPRSPGLLDLMDFPTIKRPWHVRLRTRVTRSRERVALRIAPWLDRQDW